MFRTKTKINIMLSQNLKGKAPPEWVASDWQNFYRSFQLVRLSPREMAVQIHKGHSFTPPFKNGRRREENYTTGYHVAFDFDNISGKFYSTKDNEQEAQKEAMEKVDRIMPTGFFWINESKRTSTGWELYYEYGSYSSGLDHLMQTNIADMWSSFAYSTPSSTPETPKSRVVFVIPEGIETASKMRKLYQAIAAEFKREGATVDPACKDPLRLYFGSPGCEVRGNWSAILPANVEWMIEKYERENPPPREVINNTVVKIPANDNRIERMVQTAVSNIETAVNGQLHHTCTRSAFTVGGMVGAGVLSMADAEAALIPPARAKAKDANQAERTIKDCLARGADAPLDLMTEYKKGLGDLL